MSEPPIQQDQENEGGNLRVQGISMEAISEQVRNLNNLVSAYIVTSDATNAEIKEKLKALEALPGDVTLLSNELKMQEHEIKQRFVKQNKKIEERLSGSEGARKSDSRSAGLGTTMFGNFTTREEADGPRPGRKSISARLNSQGRKIAKNDSDRERDASDDESQDLEEANYEEDDREDERSNEDKFKNIFGLPTRRKLKGNTQLQVSVAMQEIKPEDKMQKISVGSVLRTIEQFREYRSRSSAHDERNFSEFISVSVQRTLVDNEKALGVPNSSQMRYDNFHQYAHGEILCMLARYIRTHNRTKQKFIQVFVKALRQLELEKNERGQWTIQANGWSEHAQRPLSDWILRAMDVHFLMTCGKLADEILPKEDYGKMPDVGLIRAAIECLGPLKDTVLMYITEAKLKELKTFPDFLKELKSMNECVQKSDLKIQRMNTQITPVTPYKELISSALQKTDTSQKYKRAYYDNRKKEIETAQYKTNQTSRSGFTGGRYNRFEGNDSDSDHETLRRGALVYGEEDSDNENNVQHIKQEEPRQSVQVQDQVNPNLVYNTINDDVFIDSLNRMEYAEKGSTKTMTDPKLLVCFEKIDKGKCEIKDCKYNHKTEDCRNHVIRAFLKASRSPLVTEHELSKLISQAKTPTSNTPSSNSYVPSAIPRFQTQVRAGGGSGGQRLSFPDTGSVREIVGQDGTNAQVGFSQES